ncbi:type 4a pilus biogenesis protein PilO [Halobacillus litoralis]|uniref:type 4a pilus biogenesis protein PilO n=1 Tax=Halobacillus litoralis TaxID=45668 RepID=UPI002490F6EE|nr:type 4a pilus biogenesis protein PilO [Halobacillus litoralis]
MKMEWNRLSILSLLFGMLLCFSIAVFGIQVIVHPLQQEVKEKEKVVEQEEKVLSAIEENSNESERDLLLTSRTIQQQLPVVPLLDQLLIGLDRAANSSTSLINNIGISDSESIIALADEEVEGLDEEDGEEEELKPESEESEAQQLIEGLHTLQFSIDVTSENYSEMMKFMKEIQSLPRITQIESIQFEAPDNDSELGYSILLNSYYQPLYAGLANEAPQYHYGGNSDKLNPFSIEQWQEGTGSLNENDEAETGETSENAKQEEDTEEDSSETEEQL